ncbi:hypothetical protein ACGF4C_25215 [Streptomyces sp. NPDC048197]|uniref:hypothetical protein n=1 Tax=Streptomyces sp. NPDC048197 TaxID=3365511 RepID=UPI0037148A72
MEVRHPRYEKNHGRIVGFDFDVDSEFVSEFDFEGIRQCRRGGAELSGFDDR